MASSPTRTFSPSERCLEEGCTVHQHASPSDCSCSPTSNASLSQLELLERHARYCDETTDRCRLQTGLGWVDLNFERCTFCPILPGLMGNWQKRVGSWLGKILQYIMHPVPKTMYIYRQPATLWIVINESMGGLGGSANQQLVPLQVDQSVTGTSLNTLNLPYHVALVCRWLSIT